MEKEPKFPIGSAVEIITKNAIGRVTEYHEKTQTYIIAEYTILEDNTSFHTDYVAIEEELELWLEHPQPKFKRGNKVRVIDNIRAIYPNAMTIDKCDFINARSSFLYTTVEYPNTWFHQDNLERYMEN